jgi:hypothetical protein
MKLRHAALALTLLAAFASDSWGQSRDASPQVEAEQKANETPAGQSETKTQDSKVEIAPIAAPPPSPNYGDDKRAAEASQNSKEAPEGTEYWVYRGFKVKITDGLLVLFTFGLVAIGALQAIFLGGTLTATATAANAAKLNAQAVINAERAHLYVIIKQHNVSDLISAAGGAKFSDAIAKDRMTPPTLAYVFKNYGKTPATLEEIAHCVSIQEAEGGARTYATPERALEILGMGDETELIAVGFDERQFIVEDAKSLGDHDTMLFFYSRATFMDAFNRQHIIESDFLYSAGRFHLTSRRETSEQMQADSGQQPERPPRVGFFGRSR